MQIEKYKNSQILNFYKIDENKELDVILKKEKNSAIHVFIYCNNPIIGNIENKLIYEKLSDVFTDINYDSKIEFILYFSKTVEHFTLSLLQTLFSYLYDNKYKERLLLKFVGSNSKSSNIMAQMLFTQYLTTSFAENIYVYSVNDNGRILKWSKNPKGESDIPSNTKYVIADEFSPIITITNENKNKNDNFKYFFINKVSELLGDKTKDLKKIAYRINKNLRITSKVEEKKIFNKIYKDFLANYNFNVDKKGFTDWYFSFYYYDLWIKLRLFTNYINSFENIEINADKNLFNLKSRLKILQSRLEKQPLIKIFILHIILDESAIFTNLRKTSLMKFTDDEKKNIKLQNKKIENIKTFLSRIDSIMKTSDLIYDGIYELAKNIINHADGKYGFITFRIFKRGVLEGIYKNDLGQFTTSFTNYITSLNEYNDKKFEFLEILVSDNGFSGIIKKGMQNLKKIQKEFEVNKLIDEKDKVRKQINEIENVIKINDQEIGEVIFNSFYSVKSLKHGRQLIKSAAGFGLMIFMNRIKRLLGSFILSTTYNTNTYGFINYFGKNQNENGPYIYSEIVDFFKNVFAHGTTYNIVFPLLSQVKEKSEDFKEIISDKFSFENIYTGSNIVYEHLLGIKKSKKKEFSYSEIEGDINDENNTILDYTLTDKELTFRPNINGNNTKIVAFDLSGYKGDSSDLLRFLATLQFNLQGINAIVLYNENLERANKILQILSIYDNIGLDFWSDKNAILFYYQCDDNKSEYKDISLSFLLLGKTRNDFLDYNNTLREPHFTKIPDIEDIERASKSTKSFNEDIPLFIGESDPTQMLYMHLILEKEANNTIFEHNVSVLLNREIKDI